MTDASGAFSPHELLEEFSARLLTGNAAPGVIAVSATFSRPLTCCLLLDEGLPSQVTGCATASLSQALSVPISLRIAYAVAPRVFGWFALLAYSGHAKGR